MKIPRGFLFVLVAGAIWVGLLMPGVSGQARAAGNEFDRTLPHPAIPLLDEEGRHVLDSGKPYSTKMSCGNGNGSGCHDYDKMNHDYHFEQGRDEADDDFGRPRGLPQLVSPGYFGGYNCMQGGSPAALARKTNTSAAEFGDFGAAGFVKACSSCHLGGGWEEKDRTGVRYDHMPEELIADKDGDYFERDGNGGLVRWDWKQSGVREADCLTCHADLSLLRKFPASQLGDDTDRSDSAHEHWGWLQDRKFTQAGWFRYTNSALLEFLNVRPDLPEGMNLLTTARRILPHSGKPDYELILGSDGLPILHWNRAAFESNGKVQIPMRRFPSSDNCMLCHLAGEGSNRVTPEIRGSRRGFYGFGEDSKATLDADGLLLPDYKDDVHKGVTWNDDSGESRVIDNCNACHAKQYYKPLYANIDLDADHNFPKGNGDADIRNDLDKQPGPLSCEYCHDTARNPALPSGHKTILDAHRELWKANGDMLGYAENSLNKVTQVHLDVVACQTCHISGVDYRGAPITLRYRYRLGESGKPKVIPYTPASRFLVQDKTSGRVLYRHEREAVLLKKTGGDGAIVDPATGRELGKVPVNAAGEFGTPTTYEDWKAWKQACDQLLKAKGYANPDSRFVYLESNQYIVTHQTRPAVQAVPCTDCHARKQNGSINSLLSTTGLFGEGNVAEVAKLPDRRLVDEGIVELGMPYYRVDNNGRITENVADVLYASKIDPSMSILKAETARVVAGEFKTADAGQVVAYTGLDGAAGARLMRTLNSGEWLLFNSRVGHGSVRDFALILAGNLINRTLMQGARAEVASREVTAEDRRRVRGARLGKLGSDIYSLGVTNADKVKLTEFPTEAWVKLPYSGRVNKAKRLRIVYSEDGRTWKAMPAEDLVEFRPPGGQGAGYAMVRIRRPMVGLAIAQKL